MRTISRWFLISLCPLVLANCMYIHSAQVGEIDGHAVSKGRKFEVLVSETGFNLEEASRLAKAFTNDARTKQQIGDLQKTLSLFQMGPRTGNPVFSPDYADKVFEILKEKCPSGRMSGLMSVRETAKYPVVSGEIVRIVGYCQDS